MTDVPLGLQSFHMIRDPMIPPGTFILMPDGMMPIVGPGEKIEWSPYPWDPSPLGWSEEAKYARMGALDHLSGLLDDLCEACGISPSYWRTAREREREDALHVWLASERTAMAVYRPGDIVHIV